MIVIPGLISTWKATKKFVIPGPSPASSAMEPGIQLLVHQGQALNSGFCPRYSRGQTSAGPAVAFPVERGDVRAVTLARFPCKLRYSIEPDCLYVIAIAHQHRKPDYRVERSDEP